jgi:hypothetical protein
MDKITFKTNSGASVEVSRTKFGVEAVINGDLRVTVVGEKTHNGQLAIDARAMPKIVTITGPEESIRAVLTLKAEHDADVQRDIEAIRTYHLNYERVIRALER